MNIKHGIQTLLNQSPVSGGWVYSRHWAMGNKAGHLCGGCVHFSECSKRNVKNVKEDTSYCQWDTDRYERSNT